jgi:hypothetical protein
MRSPFDGLLMNTARSAAETPSLFPLTKGEQGRGFGAVHNLANPAARPRDLRGAGRRTQNYAGARLLRCAVQRRGLRVEVAN